MKKYLFVILTVCLIFPGFITGQDAKTVLKNTQKELKSLLKDIPGNKEAIKKVLSSLEADFKNPDKPDMWTEKGDIYLNITEEEEKFALLNPMYKIVFPDAPFKAKEAYMRALDAGAKDKPALKGLENAMTTISFMGSTFFDEKNYPAAFMTFDETIKIHDFIESKGGQTLYSDPEAMQLQKFYTIVSAVYGGHTHNATRYIEELYKAEYDHYFIYDTYFQLLKETDENKAVKVLREGREKFPEETALLYAEINYYLSKGNLEEPIGRIKEAIAKEPENISLYTTLGSVYDQLSQQSRQDGDIDKSDEYFNEAYKYFSQAKEIDGNSYEAYYSLGALHYNKAASMTDEINKLAEDYSREGTKKYEAIKKMMDELFASALPYFLQSHTLNPKDLNSMIALREIYARNNDYDKVEEMKTKIEAVQQNQ